MSSQKRNPTADEARGVPGIDQLGGKVEQESSLSTESVQGPVTIIIDGPAVAKGRPRMTRKGIAYTPAATRKYEAHGRLAAQIAMDGRVPISSPVKVVALVELPVPASWSRKRNAAAITGDIRPTT